LIFILALSAGSAARVETTRAETSPPELRKLHALLVVDTLSGLGESVSVDGNRIEDMLRGGIPRDRLDLTLLTGKDVTSKNILGYFKNLSVAPNDGLLFFYAGHGATDPEKGHFFALQKLATAPLLRSDLRRAMTDRHPGLVVILTDCCSTRYPLGKKRKVTAIPGVARQLDPALRCLLFQHRGVVDVTAAVEGAAFGDDDEGGLFTRTLAGAIRNRSGGLARTPGKFLSWAELFPEVEQGTAHAFSRWSHDQQARGERLDQKTQKPRAFALPRDPTRPSLTIRNASNQVVRYRHRWGTDGDWDQVVLAPEGGRLHLPPAGRSGTEPAALNVEFEDGEKESLKVGKTYRYKPGTNTKKTRSFEIEHLEPES
jgi:hypothetical protein